MGFEDDEHLDGVLGILPPNIAIRSVGPAMPRL